MATIYEISDLGRWSMSSRLRRFELEGVAGELQGRHVPHFEPQQPGEGVRLYLHVFAPRYRDAQRAARVPEGVALQEYAITFRDLEMRIGCAEILKGLPFGDHAVDSRNVHAFQGRTPAERACLYS